MVSNGLRMAFRKWGYPENGWFVMGNPFGVGDLGVITPILGNFDVSLGDNVDWLAMGASSKQNTKSFMQGVYGVGLLVAGISCTYYMLLASIISRDYPIRQKFRPSRFTLNLNIFTHSLEFLGIKILAHSHIWLQMITDFKQTWAWAAWLLEAISTSFGTPRLPSGKLAVCYRK